MSNVVELKLVEVGEGFRFDADKLLRLPSAGVLDAWLLSESCLTALSGCPGQPTLGKQ